MLTELLIGSGGFGLGFITASLMAAARQPEPAAEPEIDECEHCYRDCPASEISMSEKWLGLCPECVAKCESLLARVTDLGRPFNVRELSADEKDTMYELLCRDCFEPVKRRDLAMDLLVSDGDHYKN